jgi:hypothetical protein
MFAAVLLLIAGTLDIIYGIAAISDAHFFTDAGSHFVITSLNGWGWITLLIGIVLLTAGFSLFTGGVYGRVIGIVGASLGAIESLLAVGGQNPWWALGVFAICLWVLHGLVVFGEDGPVGTTRA